MIILNKDDIIFLHSQLIEETGGTDGLRDETLLESALNSPFQPFGENELYPTFLKKAARLCYSLVQNHAFIDGNKRIGAHAMLVFLSMNGTDISFAKKELSDFILNLASGTENTETLEKWLIEHIA